MSGHTMKSAKFLILAVLVAGCTCQNFVKDKLVDHDEFRLPGSVIPAHYDLKYTEIDFTKLAFKGDVKIDATVSSESQKIVLHRGNLDASVTSIIVNDEIIQTPKISLNKTTDFWTIELSKSMKPKDNVVIDITFNGTFRDDMIGFYWSSYKNSNGREVFLASTQFEAAHARHAFPCFDEPALKATFTVSILPPAGYHCLSNMPHNKSESSNWCVFEKSVPMSTYLVAFVVSDFEKQTAGKVSLWSRPNALKQTSYGVQIGRDALANFERALKQPYPLAKMDMVAVPDFSAGAMENWGLLTFRETASLYDQAESSAAAQQRVASVIVHECTHMWFGNLVTPKWWSYLWLSEAFARYYQYMATDKLEPGWRMDQQFVVEQHQLALGVDAEESSVAMTRPASTQAEIEKMGGSITYSKGASIVRMMELSFGSDSFQAALQDYLSDRAYNSATPDDLWRALQKHVKNIKVATVMKEWTEKPGFPYLSVSIEQDKIKLEQKRFFIRSNNKVPDTTWQVPITWLSSTRVNDTSTKPVLWLSKPTDEIKYKIQKDEWMIFNVNSAGFYRVQYDKESWNKIIDVLTKGDYEQIPVLNRAAIVDDLLNLARAEILHYNVTLRGLQYLRREKNYLPFKSALTSLDYLTRRFSTTSDSKTFNAYVVSLFSEIYSELTYDDKSKDDRLTILLRQELNQRACKFNHEECVSKSTALFKNWKSSGKAIPVNQRAVAYCTAIRHGSKEDWEFLWKQYINSNVAAEQVAILSALGCTKDTELLKSYLLKALSGFKESGIRKQDVASVFSSVYGSNMEGANYMLDFVVEHADEIFKYHGNYKEIGNLISGALKSYPTEQLIAKLNSILSGNSSYIKEIKSTLQKSLDLAKFELDWFNRHSAQIITWIKEKVKEEKETIAYRLPGNVIPLAYKLRLKPSLKENDFTFDGAVEITAVVKNPTSKIVLHTDQLVVNDTDVEVFEKSGNDNVKVTTESVKYEEKYHFRVVKLKSQITSNTTISIKIKYKGTLNTEMRGFYRSSYKDKSGKTRWLAATHLEPVGARRVFPCFDEPALKAVFDITVETTPEYFVISNTKRKPTSANKDTIYEFERTPLMSTYLVAVIVSDFKSVSAQDAAKRDYSVYSNPLIVDHMKYSLGVMGPTVEFFESKLQHQYGLPKLDMIALPDFSSGAMENWGLMTFRESNLIIEPELVTSIAQKQSVRNVVAHEITHQWFGDLVSPLWWDYLWLSEGFARYFQFHAHTEEEASWNLETQFVVDALQVSFASDASTGTHPVTAQVYKPSEIRAIFDSISYAKAASLIRMLEKLVGAKVFYGALHKYLKDCKYSTGKPEALFKAFQEKLDETRENQLNIAELMNSWTKTEGFPVIEVTFNKDVATFKQSRFYTRPLKSEQKDQSIWNVPLSWTTGKNPNFNNTQAVVFLKTKSNSHKIDKSADDWIIVNLQQTGYYRVNYEPDMWRRLIGVLNENHGVIHEINRVALLDDLLNLGRAGHVDYELVLEGARYLRHEREYAPWRAAYNGFSYLEKRFAGRPEFEAYRTFMLDLLEKSVQRLGFDDSQKDRHTDVLLRKLTLEWLAKLDHEEYVTKARELFTKEKSTQVYTVPPNKQAYVYNTAIKYGTKEDWLYLWRKLEKSIYATERMTLLAACAQSKDPELLQNILKEVVEEDSIIKLQDAKKAITNVIGNGITGVKVVLDFVEANYKALQKYLQDDTVKSILSTISKRLSTQELLDKFEKITTNSVNSMPEISKSMQSYLKRAKTEMDWYKEKGPKIHALMNKHNFDAEYRLPTFAKPVAYRLWLTPYFDDAGKEFTFDGKAEIDIRVVNKTSYLVLHHEKLNIKNISFDENLPVKAHPELTYYHEKTHKLYLYFDDTVDAGTVFTLTFEYTGELNDEMRGFYRSHYFDKDGTKKWIASTHFEPAYARRAFPCFDEPSFKAKFTVHISRPNNLRSLSNMGSKPSKTTPDGKSRSWDHYSESLIMSPYLLAFVVSDFVDVTADKSRVKTWSRSELSGYMAYSPIVGEKSLSILEEFTKIKYQLNEMNFVAVPDFDMGAMENWGLVTYREYGLTYDIERISATYKRYVVTTIAHELVHQWFGNLVTCDWWDYAWLNEGFAQYLSYIVSIQIEPEWDLMEQFIVKELQVALDFDSSQSSHPINNKITTPAEAQATFDKITYQKAASVLRMLHHSFGKSDFEKGLHNYLSKNSFRTGKPELLYQAIKESVGKKDIPGNLKEDVVTVMESWTTQSGYPVVKTARDNTSVTISQERFLVSPANDTEEKSKVYWTPITFTTESAKDFENTSPQLWLGKDPQFLTLKSTDSWYILNVQEIGFYRVNYDVANWKQLVAVLNSDKYTDIHLLNRAQILDDSLNLARGNYLDYEIALDATTYLTRETSYIPWRAYFNGVTFLAQRVEGDEAIKKLFSRYMARLLDGNVKKLGFKEDMEKDKHMDQLNRELILTQACKYGHEDCLKQARSLFAEQSLSPNIAGVVYCTKAEYGSPEDWDALWIKFTETQLASEYLALLRGLGCSKNATILEKYLNLAFEKDSKVRRQDVSTVLSSIYTSSQAGLEVSFNYYKNNLDKLREFFDSWDDVGSLFSGLAGYVVTEEQVKKFENLAETNAELKSALDKAVKKANNNLEWFKTHSPKIQKWLEEFDEPAKPTSSTEKPTSSTEKPTSSTKKPGGDKVRCRPKSV